MRPKAHAGTAIVATMETQMIHKRPKVYSSPYEAHIDLFPFPLDKISKYVVQRNKK